MTATCCGGDGSSFVTHLLVEDLQSLRAAALSGATVWSCSTGLPFLAGPDVEVRAPDALIDQAAFDDFSRAVLSAREGIAAALREQEKRDGAFAHLAATQMAQLYLVFLSFAMKGLILAKWLEATEGRARVVAGCPDLLPPHGLNLQVGLHDHVFAAIARELGRATPMGPQVIPVSAVDPGKFFAEFHHVPVFDKVFNIVNRTAGAVAYKLWRKWAADIHFGGGRGTILLLSDNEGIEESFVALLCRGWRLVGVAPPAPAPEGDGPPTADLTTLGAALEKVWRTTAGEWLPPTVAEACWRLLWCRASAAFAAHPAHLAEWRESVAHWAATFGNGPGPLIALGSGLYLPGMRLLDACLREAGIPIVCTDHGTSMGLVERHDHTAMGAVSFSDHYLAFNEETCSLFEKNRRAFDQKIHVIGSPLVMSRTRLPRIQRAAARRLLGVQRRDSTLMYLTSLSANNRPHGFGTATDAEYAGFQRRLVATLDAFKGKVVVKPYPAHRYADPEQIWRMPLPENSALAPFGEFRHIRWAADVLLLELSSSTIAWALGCDVPIIYVENAMNALTRRAVEAMREGVFFVDSAAPAWEREVEALLSLPQSELRRRWRAMAPARAAFDHRFVLGERGGFAKALTAEMGRLTGMESRRDATDQDAA